MPINLLSGLSGALTGVLAQLRNAERTGGAPDPQAQSPAPAPTAGESAVRFDFSDPPAQAAASATPGSPAAGHAATAGPAPADMAAPVRGPASPAAVTGASAAAKAPAAVDPRQAPAGTRTGQAADPEEEAQARAWAIHSLARESRLATIDRIARMADQPEQTGSAPGTARPDEKTPEPKTLAVV